jgi:hypothetical protein
MEYIKWRCTLKIVSQEEEECQYSNVESIRRTVFFWQFVKSESFKASTSKVLAQPKLLTTGQQFFN